MKDWTGNQTAATTTSWFHNDSKHERHSADYYATHPMALEKLLEREKFENVWECACGGGYLSEVLKRNWIHWKSSDVADRGYWEVIDFLDMFNPINAWEGDIITNPPYVKANEFIIKALDILPKWRKLALLFPQRYLSWKARYSIFTQNPPKTVYAFSGRVACALNWDFTIHSGSAVDYLWIVWEKWFRGDTVLKWIL